MNNCIQEKELALPYCILWSGKMAHPHMYIAERDKLQHLYSACNDSW